MLPFDQNSEENGIVGKIKGQYGATMMKRMFIGTQLEDSTVKVLWEWANGRMPCLFHEFTGLYCPGCGGTRAGKALLQGRILDSIMYHPVVIYAVILACFFTVSYLLYWITKNPRYRLYLHNSYVYIGAGIIVVQFIIKNYFLIAKGIDILALLPPV